VLLRKIARRLIRLLRPPADVPEPDALDFLESAQHAALSAWHPRATTPRPSASATPPSSKGFSLHAGVHLHANDRAGLARLLAYGAAARSRWSALGPCPTAG
jgi:hypothetical protein